MVCEFVTLHSSLLVLGVQPKLLEQKSENSQATYTATREVKFEISFIHRHPKFIMGKLRNGGHCKTLYWEFTRFSEVLEYRQFTVYLCLVCILGAIWGHLERERREVFPRINITKGWSLHRPTAIISQSHTNKIFSRHNSFSPNTTESTYS